MLVSFRPATDPTHITQLLGRVVRTPLARAIAGNDALNSVECILPRFNRQATEAIAGILRGEGTDGSGAGSPTVLIAPKRLDVNAVIDAGVWAAFDNLPTQTLPKKAAKPLKRLALLAQNLAHDNLHPNAIKQTNSLLYAKLDGLATQHQTAVADEAQKIMTVAGQTLTVTMTSGAISATNFSVTGDRSIVAVAFADGARKLTRALAKGYALHLADRDTGADQDDALEAAELHVAALARVSDVGEELDIYATKLATDLFDQYRVRFKDLNETRQGVYDDLLAMSTQPQRTATARPVSRVVETKDADGQDLPVAEKHLMSDAGGHFPIGDLRPEERTVLATEINRAGALAWYRNPVGTTRRDAVRVAYSLTPTSPVAGASCVPTSSSSPARPTTSRFRSSIPTATTSATPSSSSEVSPLSSKPSAMSSTASRASARSAASSACSTSSTQQCALPSLAPTAPRHSLAATSPLTTRPIQPFRSRRSRRRPTHPPLTFAWDGGRRSTWSSTPVSRTRH